MVEQMIYKLQDMVLLGLDYVYHILKIQKEN
jgi:hypothetical protein